MYNDIIFDFFIRLCLFVGQRELSITECLAKATLLLKCVPNTKTNVYNICCLV